MPTILGIETSCDETAAAVVRDATEVRSSVVASQIDVHRRFGGVVPEIAARQHIEAISLVISQALEEAKMTLDDVDAVAVTQGPGLIGCLLVGVCAAKAIAWQRDLPLLAINHLEGHVRSVFIENPNATSSLPTPDSPRISTLAGVSATAEICFSMRFNAGLVPTMRPRFRATLTSSRR